MSNNFPPEAQEIIERQKEMLAQQEAVLEKLCEPPFFYAPVLEAEPEGPTPYVLIMLDGKIHQLAYPTTVRVAFGDTVAVSPQTGQIVAQALSKDPGEIVSVKSVLRDGFAEVDHGGHSRVVWTGTIKGVKSGNRLLLDRSGLLAIENLGEPAGEFVREGTGITWDDIAGLEEAKRQLKEMVELPHTHPEVFKKFGYTPPKGVLLSGPPGCGKTMLGKAVASALDKIHGGKASGSSFMYVKGPEILNKYVGESESQVRAIFHRARAHKAKTGTPAVIFVDEAEALLIKRGESEGYASAAFMSSTIVPAFLSEMDGLDESAAMVILATNRPDRLDPAVVRDGRIDRKVSVTRPSASMITDILYLNLKDKPVAGKCSAEVLAKAGADEICSPERTLYQVTGSKGSPQDMALTDVVSGAMVANVAARATSFALHRALETKKNTGVGVDDVLAAVDEVEAGCRQVSHDDEIKDFVARVGLGEVKNVRNYDFVPRRETVAG
jgi:proteasome-associated ATPase